MLDSIFRFSFPYETSERVNGLTCSCVQISARKFKQLCVSVSTSRLLHSERNPIFWRFCISNGNGKVLSLVKFIFGN